MLVAGKLLLDEFANIARARKNDDFCDALLEKYAVVRAYKVSDVRPFSHHAQLARQGDVDLFRTSHGIDLTKSVTIVYIGRALCNLSSKRNHL